MVFGEISSTAKSCPHCGYVLTAADRKKAKAIEEEKMKTLLEGPEWVVTILVPVTSGGRIKMPYEIDFNNPIKIVDAMSHGQEFRFVLRAFDELSAKMNAIEMLEDKLHYERGSLRPYGYFTRIFRC